MKSSRVRMYKSPAAQSAKEIMRELREVRQNHTLAQEDNRYDDAQEYLERQEELERSSSDSAPVGIGRIARLSRPMILRKLSRCGPGYR